MANRSTGFARSLRFQITAVAALILIISLGITFYMLKILTDQAAGLYAKRVDEQHAVFTKVFEDSSLLNKTFASDYSYWDEMVSFIKNKNITFAEENIVPGLNVFNTDAVWIFDTEHRLVYSTQSSVKTAAAPDLNLTDQDFSNIFKNSYKKQYYTKIGSKVFEINATTIVPIKDTNHNGPAYGYLFAGREINDKVLNAVGQEVASDVKIIDPDNSNHYSVGYTGKNGLLAYKVNLSDSNNKVISQLYVTNNSATIKYMNKVLHTSLLVWLIFFTVLVLIVFVLSMVKVVRPLGIVVQALQTKNVGTMTRMSHLGNEFGQIAEALKHFFFQQNYMSQELESRAKLEQQAKQHAQDLEKLNNMMVGRELRMIELKKEIAQLKEEETSRLSASPVDNPERRGQ